MSLPNTTQSTARVVARGDDGFARGTPNHWKTLLASPAPNNKVVAQYAKMCELGDAVVPLDCFHAHKLQRAIDETHVQILADELVKNNQHRAFPCLVVAADDPEPKAWYDDTPFLDAKGEPVRVWTLRGNHRVHALAKVMNDKMVGKNTTKRMERGWLSTVLHPSKRRVAVVEHMD